jgi:transcriptional regulator with XRE-family HTH domain
LIQNTFGDVLRKYRKLHGFSQEKLALEANVDRTYLSELERGIRKPTINTVFALSYALGLKPSEVIREVEEEYEKIVDNLGEKV